MLHNAGTQGIRPIHVSEQSELLSLLGDIALGAAGPAVHMHAVPGLSDGSVRLHIGLAVIDIERTT